MSMGAVLAAQAMLRNIQRQQNPYAIGPMGDSYSTTVFNIYDLPKIISTIGAYCDAPVPGSEDACAELHQQILDSMATEEEYGDWTELVQAAEDGQFNNPRDPYLIVSAFEFDEMKRVIQRIASIHLSEEVNTSLQTMIAGEHGGIVLLVEPGEHTTLPDVPSFESQGKKDLPAELERYAQYAWTTSADGQVPFALEAMVTDVSQEAQDIVSYRLDASRGSDSGIAPMVRAVWLVLAVLLLVIHALLAVVQIIRSYRGVGKSIDYIAQCAEAEKRSPKLA